MRLFNLFKRERISSAVNTQKIEKSSLAKIIGGVETTQVNSGTKDMKDSVIQNIR